MADRDFNIMAELAIPPCNFAMSATAVPVTSQIKIRQYYLVDR